MVVLKNSEPERSYIIAELFNKCLKESCFPDCWKAFDMVWHAGLLQKLKSYGISGQMFGLISSFLSKRQLQLFLDGKSSQEYQ